MSTKGSAGEASIFKDSDGRRHGWITVATLANGQPDRRHRTARTRGEVAQKARELVQPKLHHDVQYPSLFSYPEQGDGSNDGRSPCSSNGCSG